jgi:hypothetical protein
MDFQQAQAGFQWLDSQFRAGAISLQQYQSGLNELRVTDPWGRLWMMQERTGLWHVYNNGTWVAAQPPIQPAAAPPQPAPAQPAARPAPAPYVAPVIPPATPAKKETSLFVKYVRMILIWAVIWILIAGGVYLFWGRDHMNEFPFALAGAGVAALLSLFLMLRTISGSWKGQIVDVKMVREETQEDIYEDVRYAIIRQTNGRTRRERAMNDWRVGDWLEKKLGNSWIIKL